VLKADDARSTPASWDAGDGLVEADVSFLPIKHAYQLRAKRIRRSFH
jgi:hypothetical protein